MLAEVKRRVVVLKDHLQAEYRRDNDPPFCVPCSNRASPRMLERNETCDRLSLGVLESTYCPGTKNFLVIVKSKQHVKRSWFKKFRSDGEGYCRAQCQTAGKPYDDTNCCPVTFPGGATDDADRDARVDAREGSRQNPVLDELDAEDESPGRR